MAIADSSALVSQTQELLAGISDALSSDALTRCANQAMTELGWSFSLSDAQKEYWAIERCRRHILYVLMTIAATKFQYKHIHLEHRYKHLSDMIKNLDEVFAKAIEDYPDLFSELLDNMVGEGAEDLIHYISNGFYYDVAGVEV